MVFRVSYPITRRDCVPEAGILAKCTHASWTVGLFRLLELFDSETCADDDLTSDRTDDYDTDNRRQCLPPPRTPVCDNENAKEPTF